MACACMRLTKQALHLAPHEAGEACLPVAVGGFRVDEDVVSRLDDRLELGDALFEADLVALGGLVPSVLVSSTALTMWLVLAMSAPERAMRLPPSAMSAVLPARIRIASMGIR